MPAAKACICEWPKISGDPDAIQAARPAWDEPQLMLDQPPSVLPG